MPEHPVLLSLPRRDKPVKQWNLDKPRDVSRMPQAISIAIRDCCRGKSSWPLFVSGGPGVGKTCAGLVLTDWVEWSYYWTMDQLYSEFAKAKCKELYSAGVNPTLMSWEDMMQMVGGADLVVIDEIGKGGRGGEATDHQKTVLHGILDKRERMATMLLSNYSPGQLSTYYDPFISSRLSAGTVVSLARGRDRRIAR